MIAKEWKRTEFFKRIVFSRTIRPVSNFNQTWYISFLAEGSGRLHRGDNHKIGWDAQEPLGQKSSNLHKSFRTQYKNQGPRRSDGAIIEDPVFTCVDIATILFKSSSQEPLSQTRSNLHGSFLKQSRIKFVKFMAPEGRVELQWGKLFLHRIIYY
jgi:hypothetical protein